MQTYIVSSTGVRVPRIIYGTAWKKSATGQLVNLAIQSGFRGIDTACQPKHYAEAGVGAGVAVSLKGGLSRTDLYLQTKFTPLSGQDPNAIPYDPRASHAVQVSQSVSASLRNLQTEYLDCVLLHSPLPTLAQTQAVWRSLESCLDSNQIRQLGISNCYELAELRRLYESARIRPAVIQNRFYAATDYDREIRAFCDHNQVIYQSFWTLSANPALLAHRTIASLASTHQRTAAQILFRYLTQIGVVPLTGTKSQAHMRDDLAIFDFELDAHEQGSVEKALFSA